MATKVIGERTIVLRVRKKLREESERSLSTFYQALGEVLQNAQVYCMLTQSEDSKTVHQMEVGRLPDWFELTVLNGVKGFTRINPHRIVLMDGSSPQHPRDVAAFSLLDDFRSVIEGRKVENFSFAVARR